MSSPGSVPLPLFSPTSCAGCRRHQRGAERAAEALFQCEFTLIVWQRCHWMGLHEAAEAAWPLTFGLGLACLCRLSSRSCLHSVCLPFSLNTCRQSARTRCPHADTKVCMFCIPKHTPDRVVTDTHKYFIITFHSAVVSSIVSEWTCRSGKFDAVFFKVDSGSQCVKEFPFQTITVHPSALSWPSLKAANHCSHWPTKGPITKEWRQQSG